jgi:hypothetical protein
MPAKSNGSPGRGFWASEAAAGRFWNLCRMGRRPSSRRTQAAPTTVHHLALMSCSKPTHARIYMDRNHD